MKAIRRTVVLTTMAALLPMSVMAQDNIRIGAVSILEGAFAGPGSDALRGVELAIKEAGGSVAGKKIELIKGSSSGAPDSGVAAARKLVEQNKVQALIGPLGGSEGIAIKEYAKNHPGVIFVNGSSAAQETTLKDPASNFFRFSSDGAQWQVGLGEYAVKSKGYKRVVTIAEDYSFPYSQISGFMNGYCAAGGKVLDKLWVPLGNKDYSSVIARIPDDVDAVYVALGGADAVNFLNQYEQAGGNKPLIAGTITVDTSVLGYKGKKPDYIVGTIAAGPMADRNETAEWKRFVASYKAAYPDGFSTPSIFATLYYVNTKALLQGLTQTNGDFSKLAAVLSTMKVDSPLGAVHIDQNRNAIANNFITEVAKDNSGQLYNKVVRIVSNVGQDLGLSKEQFAKTGIGSRDNPPLCK